MTGLKTPRKGLALKKMGNLIRECKSGNIS